MIVDRYDPMTLFELVAKLKLEMEPEEALGRGLYQGKLEVSTSLMLRIS